MSAPSLVWPEGFRAVWDRAVGAYRSGPQRPDTLFTPAEKAFLAGIGCSAQELFDFVEDFANSGEPGYETCLLVTAIRRHYFIAVLGGRNEPMRPMSELPPKDAQVAGIRWLPRIIEKARQKLRGSMAPDLMYGCGGDRPFLRGVNLTLPDFLQLVWDRGDDTASIVDAVIAARDGRNPLRK